MSRTTYARLGVTICAILWATVSPPAAQGQAVAPPASSFLNQQRAINQQIWDYIDAEESLSRKTGIDYGGWYTFSLFLYDDGVNSSRTFRRNDFRVWGRVTLDNGAHHFYARGLLSYKDFNSGDSLDGNDNDWEGMNLERGFYEFDLARAMKTYAGETPDNANLRFKIGRDLAMFGTGYTLWTRLDHMLLRANIGDLEVSGLLGRTVGSIPDIDLSRPTDRTRRAFFGTQLTYRGIKGHAPFVYALWQRDDNSEVLWTPWDYNYDSFYVGLGSQGELARNLWYSTEWVYQSGRSRSNNLYALDNVIKAWAFDAELRYLFDAPLSPQASLEYMFASGDEDRLTSPTDAAAFSRPNWTDRSFVGFGWRDTGLSLAPRMSNLHVWRAGASFIPLENKPAIRRLELGTDWFLFHKNHRAGAISDPTADVQSGYVGWEMDYYANWQVATDLAWTARYGLFFPGAAFTDRTTRYFFLVSMTWSF